jgi:hypothetical protein
MTKVIGGRCGSGLGHCIGVLDLGWQIRDAILFASWAFP